MSVELNVELFIDLIQQNPQLYDIKDRHYKNNDLKDKTWEHIAVQVHVPVDDCKRLWRNLRDRFNKEKRLHLADSEPSESSWPYYSRMAFYAKYSSPRKTIAPTPRPSLEGPSSSASTTESHIWSALDLLHPELIQGASREEHDFAPNTTSPEARQATYDTLRPWTCDEAQVSSQKKVKHEKTQQEEELARPISCNVCSSSRYDTNETFGAYVVSRLKEMNTAEASNKRKRMLAVLEEDN